MHTAAFADLVLLLAVAVPATVLMQRLRLPAIAGYLLVGLFVGPHALGWVDRVEAVESLAEIGVVLLLFTVGMEFSLPRLLMHRRRILAAGGGQMLLTIAAVAGLALAAGVPWRTALLLGFLGAMSSTAFVLKMLADSQQLDAPHGRLSVGILLFQDLCVILLIVAVSLLGGETQGAEQVLVLLGETVLGIGAVVVTARYGFPRLAALVVRTGGRELFVLFVALVVLGSAWLADLFGVSVALGAFVAGLFISESEYSHEVVSEILPFRDVFNAMFFISVGMLVDPTLVAEHGALVPGLALGLVLLKAGLVAPLLMLITRQVRLSLLTALTIAQVGEFSLILANLGRDQGLLNAEETGLVLAVATLTMIATPFVMKAAPWLAERLAEGLPRRFGRAEEEPVTAAGDRAVDVVIVGYGLVGNNVAQVLQAAGISFRCVDLMIDTAARARLDGVPMIFGDGARPEVLARAGVALAKVLVLTMPDPGGARQSVRAARRLSADVHIIVRTRFAAERTELRRLGADRVIPEEFETSIEIFSSVLRWLGLPAGNVSTQAELIRHGEYEMLGGGAGGDGALRGLSGTAAMMALLARTSLDTVTIPEDSPVAGMTLAELRLRRLTGANVVFAVRGSESTTDLGGSFRLQAGDVLIVLGGHEQILQARRVFQGRPHVEPEARGPVDSGAERK
jgi:CPA2 family monovalent cation:H+ antiporter-2